MLTWKATCCRVDLKILLLRSGTFSLNEAKKENVDFSFHIILSWKLSSVLALHIYIEYLFLVAYKLITLVKICYEW